MLCLFLLLILIKALAIVAGAYYFRYLSMPYRLVLLQVIAAICAETTGLVIVKLYHQHNLWVFNIYDLLFEVWLMSITGYLLNRKLKRSYIISGIVIVSFIWLYGVYFDGIRVLYTPYLLAKSVLLVSVYLLVLYHIAFLRQGKLSRQPALWLSLSMILFYGGNMPYYGFFNYLNEHNPDVLSELFHIIIYTLNFIRYPMVGYSFYLLGKQSLAVKPKLSN